MGSLLRLFSIILATMFLMFGAGCGEPVDTTSESKTEEQPKIVKIGYLPIINSLPLYVAIESNHLREEGIEPELIKFLTSNDLVEALIAGRIDAQVSASVSVLLAMEQYSPGKSKIFSVNVQSKLKYPDYIIVKSDSSIQTMADLEGKKLGVFPGSTFQIITKAILEDCSVDPSKVKLEQIPPTVQVEALSTGVVDAIYTLEPFASLAIEQANGRILEEAPAEKHVIDPLPGGAASVSVMFVQRDSKAAKSLVAAFDKAIDEILKDEKSSRKVLTKYVPISEDLAVKVNIVDFWPSDRISIMALQNYAEFLYKEGDIKSKPDVASMVLILK